MKISYKLILIFIFIALLPTIAIGYLSFQKGKSIISENIKGHLFEEANKLLETIDRTIQSRQQEIIALRENHVIKNEESGLEEIKKELLELRKKNPDYISLSFFNMDRVRLVDTADLEIGKQHEMVPYWEDVLLGKISSGRDVRVAEELKIPIIYFAAPVYNDFGKSLGVVVARYNPQKLTNLITAFETEEKENEGTQVVLIDKEKNIIFSSDPYFKDKVLMGKMLDLSAVRQATEENKEGVIEEFYLPQKKNVLITFVREKGFYDFTGNDWALITVSDVKKSFLEVTDFRNQIIIFSVFILFVTIIIGFFYGKIFAEPLEKLTDIAKKVSAGDIKQRANVKAKDERGYLAKIFNQMLDSIEKSQTELKDAEKRLADTNINLEIRVKERTAELEALKNNLEKTVEEKTQELQDKIKDLEKFKSFAIDRELKIIELKRRVTELEQQQKN